MSEQIQARLRLREFELLSLIRTGFLVSVSIAVTIVTSSVVIYVLLQGMGVFESVDQVLGDLFGSASTLSDALSFPVVLAGSIALGAFEVLVTTMLVALFGYIYNLTVPFTGGLEVTLSQDAES